MSIQDLYIFLKHNVKGITADNCADRLKSVLAKENATHGTFNQNSQIPSHQEAYVKSKSQAIHDVRHNMMEAVNRDENDTDTMNIVGKDLKGTRHCKTVPTDSDNRKALYSHAQRVLQTALNLIKHLQSFKGNPQIIGYFGGFVPVTPKFTRKFAREDLKSLTFWLPEAKSKPKAKAKATRPEHKKPVQLSLI